MQIPREAIEKAIEGGWRHEIFIVDGEIRRDIKLSAAYVAEIKAWRNTVLDSTFWQSLGKALGWEPKYNDGGNYYWGQYAHRFYDLILSNQDTQPFWDELLPHMK